MTGLLGYSVSFPGIVVSLILFENLRRPRGLVRALQKYQIRKFSRDTDTGIHRFPRSHPGSPVTAKKKLPSKEIFPISIALLKRDFPHAHGMRNVR